MPQRVRRDAFTKASMSGSFCAGISNALVRHRLVFATVTAVTGEQISSWLLPAPILTKGFQQRRTEWQIAVMAALAAFHVNDHSLAIDHR